jgi:hypothetical protein
VSSMRRQRRHEFEECLMALVHEYGADRADIIAAAKKILPPGKGGRRRKDDETPLRRVAYLMSKGRNRHSAAIQVTKWMHAVSWMDEKHSAQDSTTARLYKHGELDNRLAFYRKNGFNKLYGR